MSIQCAYVEKKPEFAVEARAVREDLVTVLQIQGITGVRLINRYLLEHITTEDFQRAKTTILSEPAVDLLHDGLPQAPGTRVFASEYLPGQFDQRADSCAQCISLATGKDRPLCRTARIYLLEGEIGDGDFQRIKRYLINPVESREASLELPDTLETDYPVPEDVRVLAGFTVLERQGLEQLLEDMGLAMDLDDLRFCQNYFKNAEERDPTVTEIRMIDTYWSDHCRHTTFLTEIDQAEIVSGEILAAYDRYLELRETVYGGKERPITLMDLATIGAKYLRKEGLLPDLDQSEEINACSVKIKVDVDGVEQDWLLMFKNETHNHPTEIEPFGGAATCLGGAIRDPLSGRSYVYQAMRVTGAGNPLEPLENTLPGKLPQRKIVQTAAAGYSSYGNQVGLATGHVHEIYHPGYVAKRMEIGAVIGAAPAGNVVREVPDPGDVVILLGGRTGRDGCGGATGSSKSHTAQSLESCGAEVQKGNPPEERKIQRLFRNPEATRLIRRCNDFGAGGVSVSVGELADGVQINLDAVPKKYDGLDGTELAISESQERMSVVVAPENADRFMELAAAENLEAVEVAKITSSPRLVMNWRGETVVDLSRDFLDSNGAPKHTAIHIGEPRVEERPYPPLKGEELEALMGGLDLCSQKGLVERFGSTIGSGTILMPYGGKHQLTPSQAMAAKIPVLEGETETCSLMAWGFDPEATSRSPYHGGALSVVWSMAKIIPAGGSRKRCWLTFQEYFERMKDDPARWGKPAAALLGALKAQLELEVAAIGGKDSMSGSFEDIDVPPTLVSFAVSTAKAGSILSPELKTPGNKVYLIQPETSPGAVPDFGDLRRIFDMVEERVAAGEIRSAWALDRGGVAGGLCHICFGNRLGVGLNQEITAAPCAGGFLLEAPEVPGWEQYLLGTVLEEYVLRLPSGEKVDLEGVQRAWESTLEPVFPYRTPQQPGPLFDVAERGGKPHTVRTAAAKVARPKVVIPVFPGTNCEYDTARAFRDAGAEAEIFVVRNRTAGHIAESVEAFVKLVSRAQMVAIPGGFSGGDEPDGSAKFITAFFRNPLVTQEVHRLLGQRDGLMCGICNGFQALIKLGLVPYGEIRDAGESAPTLTFNHIGRHQSTMVRTRITSNRSPWLCAFGEGEIYTVAADHGEGRFVVEDALARELWEKGQIATVYVDEGGNPSGDIRHNPNHSAYAVEGLLSPDGRVFGKMCHTERMGDHLYRNIRGNTRMDMFAGAVEYYR